MHSSLIAVVLCILAQTAGAQCVSTAETTQPATAIRAPQAAAPRSGGELITTAAASTRDAPPVARATPARRSHDEDTDRGGTGMLLAALALMSGIALRRYNANGQ